MASRIAATDHRAAAAALLRWLEAHPIFASINAVGHRIVRVAQAARVIGLIAIADAIRPTSKAAVAKLRELEIEVVMLTGDNAATAKRIAADFGIDSVLADVLPDATKPDGARASGVTPPPAGAVA